MTQFHAANHAACTCGVSRESRRVHALLHILCSTDVADQTRGEPRTAGRGDALSVPAAGLPVAFHGVFHSERSVKFQVKFDVRVATSTVHATGSRFIAPTRMHMQHFKPATLARHLLASWAVGSRCPDHRPCTRRRTARDTAAAARRPRPATYACTSSTGSRPRAEHSKR